MVQKLNLVGHDRESFSDGIGFHLHQRIVDGSYDKI